MTCNFARSSAAVPHNTMQRAWGLIVRDAFFTRVDGTEFDWKCKCNIVRKQSGSGYTNLVSHVRDKHPENLQTLRSDSEQPASTTTSLSTPLSFLYGKRAEQLFGWIDLVVSGLLPFSVVSNSTYRKHVRYEGINRETLGKYMRNLTFRVEAKIKEELPSQFAIFIDGWSAGDTHYVACFASYFREVANGYTLAVLGFSPLEDEASQSAKHHYEYIEFVLSLFERSFDNVVAVIGDNCTCNKSLANLIGCPLLGCSSHRFNLCVMDFIRESSNVIEKVNGLMRKLRYPIAAAKLRQHTYLRAKCQNTTRWSSTSAMLN